MSEKYAPFETKPILLYEKDTFKIVEKHIQVKMKNFV